MSQKLILRPLARPAARAARPQPAPAQPGTPAGDRLLTPAEAARLLQVSPASLERWRTRGGGPPFVRATPRVIRYRQQDLDAFIASRVVATTADHRG